MARLRNSCQVRNRRSAASTAGSDSATTSGRWNIIMIVLERELARMRDVGCEGAESNEPSDALDIALDALLSSGCLGLGAAGAGAPMTAVIVAGGSGSSSLGAESSVSVSEGVRVKCARSLSRSRSVAIVVGASRRTPPIL
jgi:L-aminopeptidase/D-esterase-like protein